MHNIFNKICEIIEWLCQAVWVFSNLFSKSPFAHPIDLISS